MLSAAGKWSHRFSQPRIKSESRSDWSGLWLRLCLLGFAFNQTPIAKGQKLLFPDPRLSVFIRGKVLLLVLVLF
jgi:hypothetical protein